jgi:hypothetical protein
LDRWTPFISVPRWYDAVASPCHIFSCDHDHVVETSRADHYRAPYGNRRITPLVPTSVDWDDRCVPLSYKKGNPSAVLPLPSLACFRARQCRRSYFSPPASFGQPASSSSPLLLRPSLSKLFHRLRRPPPEESWKETERRTPAHRRPCPRSWRRLSPSVGRLQRCTSASSAEFVFF